MRKVIAGLLLFPCIAMAANPLGRGFFPKAAGSGRYTPAIQVGHLGPLDYLAAEPAAWAQNGTNVTVAGAFDASINNELQIGVQVRIFLELPVPGLADLCSGVVNVSSTIPESGVIVGRPNGDGLGYNPPLGPNTVAVDFVPRAVGNRSYVYQYTCDVQ